MTEITEIKPVRFDERDAATFNLIASSECDTACEDFPCPMAGDMRPLLTWCTEEPIA